MMMLVGIHSTCMNRFLPFSLSQYIGASIREKLATIDAMTEQEPQEGELWLAAEKTVASGRLKYSLEFYRGQSYTKLGRVANDIREVINELREMAEQLEGEAKQEKKEDKICTLAQLRF